jgi:hypothetical protein
LLIFQTTDFKDKPPAWRFFCWRILMAGFDREKSKATRLAKREASGREPSEMPKPSSRAPSEAKVSGGLNAAVKRSQGGSVAGMSGDGNRNKAFVEGWEGSMPRPATPRSTPPEPVAPAMREKSDAFPVYDKASDKAKDFRGAFAAASKAGDKEFMWDGRKYSTKKK